MSRYRHKISRNKSRRSFSRNARSHRRNSSHRPMRGGIRL